MKHAQNNFKSLLDLHNEFSLDESVILSLSPLSERFRGAEEGLKRQMRDFCNIAYDNVDIF